MKQTSFEIIGDSLRYMRENLRTISLAILTWYTPVQALDWIRRRVFMLSEIRVLSPLVETVVFRFLYIVVGIVMVRYFFDSRDHNTESMQKPGLDVRALAPILLAYGWLVLAAVPNAVVDVLTARITGTAALSVLRLPLAVLPLAMAFGGYVLIPVAMLEEVRGFDALKRSWEIVRSRIDVVIVLSVMTGLLGIVLATPSVLFLRARSMDPSTSFYLALGYLVFAFPIGFSVALNQLVAARFYAATVLDNQEPAA